MPHTQLPSSPTVVITGSSSGIGQTTAISLAEKGYDVLVHGHANRDGAFVTQEAVCKLNQDAKVVLADIGSEIGRRQLIDEAYAWRQSIVAWVHCAGVDVLTGEAAQGDFADKLDRLWQVDVRGTLLLARLVATRMLENPPPNASMVFTGWDQSTEGMEGDAGQMFGPIKAAVTSFATNLAQTLAPHIRVNTVAPGWIQTAWGQETDDYWDRRAKRSSLMNRWGTPNDVAAAIAFLISPDASFITGQTLAINGGWNRRGELRN